MGFENISNSNFYSLKYSFDKNNLLIYFMFLSKKN